ncbi:OmpP1/FadL family transporter [Jannaschia aquimarina]|uniref:Outer membrane protein transport protein (OMPP1/FadL/TodX) n=1 Tax=Jannaschia aquimarina TaxID=935700 RepID=A0A0D1EE17_9RHOB|nr:outer membrane protein transport protein [Jannaschia aquimarina]KIT15929.1 Outer membrane protein transport protein (OMPP1/FadL/TodX) [Jannaschia aquimarina]SNS98039.1 long-chain fatty acid transport protein [Jannaschia aquimarina]
MTRITIATAALLATTSIAQAGGLDRSGQSISPLFDEAGTTSLSFSYVNPNLTGDDSIATQGSYDAGESYTNTTLSYANTVNDKFSYAVIADQPFGADIFYNDDPTTSALGGTTADLGADAISFVGRYKINERFSVFGGLRAQNAGGRVVLNGIAYANALGARAGAVGLGEAVATAAQTPGAANQAAAQAILAALGDEAGTAFAGVASGNDATAALEAQLNAAGFGTAVATAQGTFGAVSTNFGPSGGYEVEIEDDWGLGYTFGVAYEIPEIALRFAATYHSEVSHNTTGVEQSILFGPGEIDGDIDFATPQSVNLEFQTGLNQKTLLLASMRWTDWDDFDVVPELLGTDLADIEDSYTWNLGVARRFTDNLVGLASIRYEKANDNETVSPLGPTDGLIGLSLGVRYTADNLNVSGGINYTKIGDANPGVAGNPVASFEDNSAVGVGLRVAYKF